MRVFSTYESISDGGFTFSLVEKGKEYYLKVKLTNFGLPLSVKILVTPKLVEFFGKITDYINKPQEAGASECVEEAYVPRCSKGERSCARCPKEGECKYCKCRCFDCVASEEPAKQINLENPRCYTSRILEESDDPCCLCGCESKKCEEEDCGCTYQEKCENCP